MAKKDDPIWFDDKSEVLELLGALVAVMLDAGVKPSNVGNSIAANGYKLCKTRGLKG